MTAEDYEAKMNDILDRALLWYGSNPRGINGDAVGCSYEAGCAVAWGCGFNSSVSEWDEVFKDDSSFENICYNLKDKVWDFFTEENRLESEYFWSRMQTLHDSHCYWRESPDGIGNLLTTEGKDRVDLLRKEIIPVIANDLAFS